MVSKIIEQESDFAIAGLSIFVTILGHIYAHFIISFCYGHIIEGLRSK